MPSPTVSRLLSKRPDAVRAGMEAPPTNPAGGPPSAPAPNARQDAHDKIVEGLTVLAHDYPAAEDMLTQFEKMYQTWMGSGQPQQGPKQGEPADIPSSKGLPSGPDVQGPPEGGDQAGAPQGDRGGPPPIKGQPFWKRGK